MSAPKVSPSYGAEVAIPAPGATEPQRSRRRRTPDVTHTNLDEAAKLRLGLQHRERTNLRRHLRRGIVRVSVLLAGDLLVFVLLRALVRGVRDYFVFGQNVASAIAAIIPRGFLSGWQFAVGLVVSLVLTGTYGPGDRRRNPSLLLGAVALATALPLWDFIWTRGFELFAVQYVVTLIAVWTSLVTERLTVNRVVRFFRPAGSDAVPTLFVGSRRACRTAMRGHGFDASDEHRNIGYVSSDTGAPTDALGPLTRFSQLLHDCRAEAVVVCGDLTDDQFHDVVETSFLAGCQVLAVPRILGIEGLRPSVLWRGGQAIFELTRPELRARQLLLKRTIDLTASALGLLVLSPLLLLTALIVRLDSPGPALFWQTRVGRGGKLFRIVKFRSMVMDAESRRAELTATSMYKDERLFKIKNDPRMTRVGRWLRRTSVDELPQLLNVLIGDMSLVGPRPPLPSEVAYYEEHHFCRFEMKPGITGPWQVAGRNRITDFEEVVRLERDYIARWSQVNDLRIILSTVPVVLRMDGAH